ncbi:CANX [Mytilus edulis]|uniref:CANX n=1 Tax=Mytilus edulis TaxID=6550 RepID=A0A8S3U9F4_MYTED|nr:CANX [Mytilus edulis]
MDQVVKWRSTYNETDQYLMKQFLVVEFSIVYVAAPSSICDTEEEEDDDDTTVEVEEEPPAVVEKIFCGKNDIKQGYLQLHEISEIKEKHAKKPTANLDSYFTDKKTHLYKLVVNPDNSFEIFVDNTLVNEGSLLEDMRDESEPEYIIDEAATMPDGWLEDEPELIPDPDAEKPEDCFTTLHLSLSKKWTNQGAVLILCCKFL